MEIKNVKQDQSLVVEVSGQLDIQSSDKFTMHCKALVDQGEKNIVLDFSKLKYLSSAGLRAILVLDRQLLEAGGTLALCAPSEPAKMVLTISGFLDKLKVYNGRDELP